MKRVIVLVLSLSLIGSVYYIYDNLDNKEDILIEEEKLEEEFISYTLNGSSTELSYEELASDYMVNSITCENGSIAEWSDTDKSIKLSSINVPDYCVIDFKEIPKPTLADVILRDNPNISERTDFSVTNVANTSGTIYKTASTEDGSIVYYYSGNTTNNWVYFGGFYWRIIRTNEDGSVRLLYAGTSHNTTSGYIGQKIWYDGASGNPDPNYTGYMFYGTSSLSDARKNTKDSTIKAYVDNWYQTNLLTNYDKYISKSAIYCNDRSVGSNKYTDGETFHFGAYTRLYTNKTPTYKCGGNTSGGLFESTQAIEDKFSASTTGGGNGQLTYGVALMTADEVAFAGGVFGESLSSPYTYYVLNSDGVSILYGNTTTMGGATWFTMSPKSWYRTDGSIPSGSLICIRAYVYGSIGEIIGCGSQSSSVHIRPVLSISDCAKVLGTGTPEDPYIIDEVNSTC